MKNRVFALLLALLMLALPGAVAEEEAPPMPLKLAEIEQFNQLLLERAVADGLPSFAGDGGFVVRGEGYELLLAGADVSSDSLVLSAALLWAGEHGEDEAALPLTGPRDSQPGMSVEALLQLFPNDNDHLAGRRDSAVLYMDGELPAAVSAGFLLRDGQAVQLVEYDVYYQAGDGVVRAGIQYTVQENFVTALRSFVGKDALSQQAAAEELQKLGELQEETSYIAYADTLEGKLSREDMVLGGLDFFDTDYQAAVSILGEPANEERHQDGDSEIITCQWPGLEAVFTLKEGVSRTMRLSVQEGLLEGPRGLRLEDTLAQALSRFPHGGVLGEAGGTLYGDAENQVPPYGLMRIEADSTLLYYAFEAEAGKAGLVLAFVDDALVSMTLTYL